MSADASSSLRRFVCLSVCSLPRLLAIAGPPHRSNMPGLSTRGKELKMRRRPVLVEATEAVMRPASVIVGPARSGVRRCDSTRRAVQICQALRRGARSSRRGEGRVVTAPVLSCGRRVAQICQAFWARGKELKTRWWRANNGNRERRKG
ncbi:hypothetical protein CC86DRAFT_375921 [Ophiobolus disseminans]|uniref:Uncharacterized protein n=1 Tax=Ophiobolus disseminans TaxID=1469910 RepID=A0A6A6ZBM4_9PLEO|nr:hypothetical protein CC86DRAFT_375921 [Ophiobolus disseminans]